MIHELRNVPPHIDFGFGITECTIGACEKATVWLSTLYNLDVYSAALDAPGADVMRISDYEHEVAYSTPGTYTISLAVAGTLRKISLQSNTLTLTVI